MKLCQLSVFCPISRSLNSLPVGHSDGSFADLALMSAGVDPVSLFSLALSHEGGSLHDGKSVQGKAELGVDGGVSLELQSND